MIEIDPTCSFCGSVNRYRQHNGDERERRDRVLKARAQELLDPASCALTRPLHVIGAIFWQQCAVLSRCSPTYTATDMPPFGHW